MIRQSRRKLLRVTGAALAATVAGCSGGGDGGGDSGDGSGSDGSGDSGDGGGGTTNGGGSSGITADAMYETPVDNPTGIMHKSEYDSEADATVSSLVVGDSERQEEYLVELDGISETVKKSYTLETPGDEVAVSGLVHFGSMMLANAATDRLVDLSLGGVNIDPATVELPATPKGLHRQDNARTIFVVLERSDGDVVAQLNNDNSGISQEVSIPGGTGYGMFAQQTAPGQTRVMANNRDSQFVRVGFQEDTPEESFDIDFGPVKDVATPDVAAESAWAVTDDGQIAEFTPPTPDG